MTDIEKLTAKKIQEELKVLKGTFWGIITGQDRKISFLEFIDKHYYPTLLKIHDSKYFAQKEKDKIKQFEILISNQKDLVENSMHLHGDDDDAVQRDTLDLKNHVMRQLEDLNESFQTYPSETREDSVQKNQLEREVREVLKEEKESLDYFKIFVDRKFSEYDKLHELQESIDRGDVVDQKFLYWDPNATERWKDMCIRSEYGIHKISKRLINNRIEDMLNIIEKNTDTDAKFFDLVNLGAGGGFKDYRILNSLLDRMKRREVNARMAYIPIEQSVSMLQSSIKFISGLFELYPRKLEVKGVLGDFLTLERYIPIIYEKNEPKIYGLLGNTLGNFLEDDLVNHIDRVMRQNDFLVVGVDLIGNRTEKDLEKCYGTDIRSPTHNFFTRPIYDHVPEHKRETYAMQQLLENPIIQKVRHYGSVQKSLTVFTSVNFGGTLIRNSFSTKYDLENLKDYLRRNSFDILEVFEEENYAKLIMRKERV